MATPYFQFKYDRVTSTQDLAREKLRDLPVVVIAAEQSQGRGRTDARWLNAPRPLAVSFAFHHVQPESRPLSLMAGVAANRALEEDILLKWPNDVLHEDSKIGGILVERTDDSTVIGFGLNLWWPDAPDGVGALWDDDPGPAKHVGLGALWAAELAHLISEPGWPREEYLSVCATLERDIAWDDGGPGRAVDVSEDGGLVVEIDGTRQVLYSGAVRHIR